MSRWVGILWGIIVFICLSRVAGDISYIEYRLNLLEEFMKKEKIDE